MSGAARNGHTLWISVLIQAWSYCVWSKRWREEKKPALVLSEPAISEASARLNTHFFFQIDYCANVFVCRFINMNKLLLLLIIVCKWRKQMREKFQYNCKFIVVLKKTKGFRVFMAQTGHGCCNHRPHIGCDHVWR